MKNFIALPIIFALIPGISYAADNGAPEAWIIVIEKKLDEIRTGQVQNYRLVDGAPDPFVGAVIAKAQKTAAANGGAPTLLGAIENARLDQTAPLPLPPGATSTCVNNQVSANLGTYYSNRDCSAGFTASRAWVHANMYSTGNYVLQASWGNIDFGHSKAGQSFAVHYTPSGDASEFVWLINATN